jgi:hypothetical protein
MGDLNPDSPHNGEVGNATELQGSWQNHKLHLLSKKNK